MYEARKQKDILNAMLNDSRAQTGIFEGTFQYDTLSSNSIEISKVEVELEQLYKAAFADTSWEEFLTMIAKQYGVIRKLATKAIGNIAVNGTGTVPPGSLFNTQSGIQFETIEEVTIETSGIIQIKAVESGMAGNVGAGLITQIPMSIPGINSVINLEATYDGFDEEKDRSLLERYLFKVRNPATSGNKNHYIMWAREVEGVGDARCIPTWNGPGTVKIVIVDDNHEAPSAELVNKTRDYIESVRPMGWALTVLAATSVPIHITAKVIGEVALEEFKSKVNAYFKTIGFDSAYISIARVGKLLLECIGVKDYDDLLLNGFDENISLKEEELPVIGVVSFDVSISA